MSTIDWLAVGYAMCGVGVGVRCFEQWFAPTVAAETKPISSGLVMESAIVGLLIGLLCASAWPLVALYWLVRGPVLNLLKWAYHFETSD